MVTDLTVAMEQSHYKSLNFLNFTDVFIFMFY